MSDKKDTKTAAPVSSVKKVGGKHLESIQMLHTDLSRRTGSLKVLQAETALAQAKLEGAVRDALIAAGVHENASVNLDTGEIVVAPAR